MGDSQRRLGRRCSAGLRVGKTSALRDTLPWDDDKVVYLLQRFLELHCLGQLCQDGICNADDTPRYAGFQSSSETGTDQVRLRKDWEQLEQ